jgi:hypothetical protein
MRTWILTVAAAAALGACGPSNREVALAKTARFHGDKLQIFAAMRSAIEDKYKLDMSDETTLTVRTMGRWYTPEGLAASNSGPDQWSTVPDKSLNIILIAKLLPEGDNWVVSVEPHMIRYFAGRPNPDAVKPDDPSVPGWATGKVDQLQYAIYDALKPYEVKSPGGIAPAAPPAGPAAAPPAPAPSPPQG